MWVGAGGDLGIGAEDRMERISVSLSHWEAARIHVPEDAKATFHATFQTRLREGGLLAALALLNHRTRFRFTGLYRVVPPQLQNVSLYDRENPTLNVSGAVCGLAETYCASVYESGRPLRIGDATADARLRAHPNRESIQSYAGVPIRGRGGDVVGTLCHFDGRPRITPSGELAVLQEAAALLVPWLSSADVSPG